MHVPWIFVIAGARAPVAELASLDVHVNEPYAARGTNLEGLKSLGIADMDAARDAFLLKEPPNMDQGSSLPLQSEAPLHSEQAQLDPSSMLQKSSPPLQSEALWRSDVSELASSRAPDLRSEPAQETVPETLLAPWHSVEPEPASSRSPAPSSRAPGESFLEQPRRPAARPPGPPGEAPRLAELRGAAASRNASALAAQPRVEERILDLTRDLFVEAPLLFLVPGLALVAIAAVLILLLRYAQSGLGAVNHWSGQLTRRTDWAKLEDGAFVKVCGTTAAPDRHLSSPLGGRPCAAYRISIAYDDGDSWVPLITREDRTGFHILDDAGRALLIAENDFHMYDVASEEWSFPAGAAPPQFLDLCAPAPARGLRFREEIVAIGQKVSCVGAVSRLALESSTLDSAGALRPAYAVLMFRDDRIPWAKMTDLAQGDWKQLAARVLVSADR